MTEWLNCHNPYTQYTHEPPNKLKTIVEKYGFAFDDNYWYWIPKYRKSKTVVPNMLKRNPLWTYPCKSIARENGKPKKKYKYKLLTELIK